MIFAYHKKIIHLDIYETIKFDYLLKFKLNVGFQFLVKGGGVFKKY